MANRTITQAFIYALLSMCIPNGLNAQVDNLEKSSFVAAAFDRITGVMTEREATTAAVREATSTALTDARRRLTSARSEVANATAYASRLREEEALARADWNASVNNKTRQWSDAAYEKWQETLKTRAAQDARLSELRMLEGQIERQIALLSSRLDSTNIVLMENRGARDVVLTDLQNAREAWVKRPSDESWLELLNRITRRAAQQSVNSEVTLKTVPNAGAIVYYQTVDERKKRLPPWTVGSPTEAKHQMPIGYYHVWAERGGVPTSKRTDVFKIINKTESISLVERMLH